MWSVKSGFKIEMWLCALVGSKGSSCRFRHGVTKAENVKRGDEYAGIKKKD